MTVSLPPYPSLTDRRVLLREDFNIPLEKGAIRNHQRIERALPTIQALLKEKAAVMVASHLGRPQKEAYDSQLSLAPIAIALSQALKKPVPLIQDWVNTPPNVKPGEIVLLENTRFNPGEQTNDPHLAKKIASLCDIFIMDAFATAHRAHASTVGAAQYAKAAYAGPLLTEELQALSTAFNQAQPPFIAIVGGAKVSTKISLLKSFIKRADALILGGGIANTFLAAKGYPMGTSLHEAQCLSSAKALLALAQTQHTDIVLPVDTKAATECSDHAQPITRTLETLQNDEMILDIGPQTIQNYASLIQNANTIVWNGPVGVFERLPFRTGTHQLALAVAKSSAFSLAGGGETLAALDLFNLASEINYLSTGGSAFLAYLEGKALPAVTILEQRDKTHV